MIIAGKQVPGSLFKAARERMLRDLFFTPEDIRDYLLTSNKSEFESVSHIQANWTLVAQRVTRSCIDELRTSGEIEQFKRGVWHRIKKSP